MSTRLDPAPWVWMGRSATPDDPNNGGEQWSVTLEPRLGYEQDTSAYFVED